MPQPLQAEKEILGYKLQDRIGSGGFGEVWSAIAPGGLLKAVKVVYGFHDEKRAQAELKALDRVKQLRHPFLLSLERIEIFEGQLIVVSELADNSLADVFNECTSRGEPGIPRDELIKYMRCAADALDYLCVEHNLQHLDIKPENLLMVSGHVKVADFGLIKDLQKASQSLMSGMTPAYAAPELFDGRPSMKSDQYALAIAYQEMLTGVRPFPGNTPAQLAAQHIHGKPNLRPLPPNDQPPIAKALSKNPELRFNTCAELIEELTKTRRPSKKVFKSASIRFGTDTDANTVDFSNAKSSPEVTALISGQHLPFQTAELKSLDPPTVDQSSATFQPTLVVGIGSTANRVAQKLKGQLTSRHGSTDNLPSVKVICIDTDRQALGELKMSRPQESLAHDEVIETPLRKPEKYRERLNSHLSWLSRRWIYNVPRSLQTEGLRPLGRLAFADHFENICDQLQNAITDITTEQGLVKSAEALDMDPGTLRPRVFIVTSISGGIGSGMTLDLAYTTKLLLQQAGHAEADVTGILMHSTYQRTRDPGLSAANAFAFLSELRHYVENGFPGDPSIGLPDFEGEPPFDYTYFNDLGHDLPRSEFETKLDKIAEYIYLSSATKCSTFMDACRSGESDNEQFSLRTFGLSSNGLGNNATSEHTLNRVGRGLVRRWTSHTDDNQTHVDLVDEFQLARDAIVGKFQSQSKEQLQPSYDQIIQHAKTLAVSETQDRLTQMVFHLNSQFGVPHSRRDSSYQEPEFCLTMTALGRQEATNISNQILSRFQQFFDSDQLQICRIKTLATSLRSSIEENWKQLDQQAQVLIDKSQQQIISLQNIALEKLKPESRQHLDSLLDDYCSDRFNEFAIRVAKTFYSQLLDTIDDIEKELKQHLNQIENMAAAFDSPDEIIDESVDERDLDYLLQQSIEHGIAQHIHKTEIQIYQSVIKEHGGYLNVLNSPGMLQKHLANDIRQSAQRILADSYKKISLQAVVDDNKITIDEVTQWLREKINEARPRVSDCGGAARLLIGIPALGGDPKLANIVQQGFNLNSCIIPGTHGPFVVCFEGEDISLANVAYRLLEARPDAAELVKRIHTRNDVDWMTLDDLL